MKKWNVNVPVVASVFVQVKADTEAEAISAAMNLIYELKEPLFNPNCREVEIDEWEALEHVTQGNFYKGPIHSARAEIDDWANEEEEEQC